MSYDSVSAADDPAILYVLMRTDLPDYEPGKSMAQANHAGTKFIHHVLTRQSDNPGHMYAVSDWIAEGGGFGTCVVLGMTYTEMRRTLQEAGNAGYVNGIIHDPGYPIKDGDQMQQLPIDTCGYVFGRKAHLAGLLGGFRLFRA